ncbi:sulfatase-like hydrolase/transferase [Jiangella asiatica]|uniref:Arylsulfatase n=1 Tax=Jiangella asiatica TaxID=2530372 RepID=A0A4R5DN06_9ACTN|nr:sulfatase-like hydrolase/transferase [Jiangella asiatica]TDE14917.1 arylsulfatase [Jiangella asiatica]
MSETDRTSRRPNVVVFLTDQQRWDTTGYAGNPLRLTPNLDRMALQGTHAACAITPNPLCAPARSSLQTGLYPTATGVHRNDLSLATDADTVARRFGAAGYACGYIGKWHLADGPAAVPADQRAGYTSWLASNILEFTSDAYRTILFDDDDDPVALPGYRADALTDAAIRFVADHDREPFFLFLSFIEPHQQNETDSNDAPEGYAEYYGGRWMPPDLAELGGTAARQLAGYLGQVKRLDECLGRLREALRSLDLLDDTIIAFTSDHGSHFRTRNKEFKRSSHDASIRVPMVLDGPVFRGGGRISSIVNTVDLVPTLLDAAGLEVPDSMQGSSLVPLLGGHAPEAGGEGFSQVGENEVGRVLRTPKYKYYVAAPDADPRNTGTADRYVERELYDLEFDPYELVNLIDNDEHVAVRLELADRLAGWVKRIEGVTPTIVASSGEMVRRRKLAPRVRTNGLRGVRYGHQPARAAAPDPLDS